MNNLDELLQALTTVITYYHRDQVTILPTVTTLETDWTLVQAPEIIMTLDTTEASETPALNDETFDTAVLNNTCELKASLDLMIHQSTKQNETRRSLLQYMLHVILLLKQMNAVVDASIESILCPAAIQEAIVELLTNIQTLYHVPYYQTISLNYAGQDVMLYGFSLSSSKLATHLKHLIMQPLEINSTTTKSTITAHIECLFLRHQVEMSSILASEHKKLVEEHSQLQQEKIASIHENQQLKQEKKEILDEHSAAQQEINTMFIENARLKKERAELNQQISQTRHVIRYQPVTTAKTTHIIKPSNKKPHNWLRSFENALNYTVVHSAEAEFEDEASETFSNT